MRTPRRILVVRTDRLGDVVLATPLIRALRRTFPAAHIAAMVRPYARDILVNNPHLDEILIDDCDGRDRGRDGFWRQVGMLRERTFDTALLLLPTERAAWMLFFAGIPRRVGVGTKLYGVLTFMQSVSRNKYIPLRHEADYCLDLGRKIGAVSENLTTEVFLTDVERGNGWKRLSEEGAEESDILVGVHPGSGGSSPNWDGARYVELVELLLESGDPEIRVVLTGEEKDVSPPRSSRVIDLRGKLTLRQLMEVISHIHSCFSSSTGPMHIAAALKVPTVSLFCPLPACSPTLWGPKGNSATIILPPEGFCEGRCPGDPKVCRFEEIDVRGVARTILDSLTSIRGVGPARKQKHR